MRKLNTKPINAISLWCSFKNQRQPTPTLASHCMRKSLQLYYTLNLPPISQHFGQYLINFFMNVLTYKNPLAESSSDIFFKHFPSVTYVTTVSTLELATISLPRTNSVIGWFKIMGRYCRLAACSERVLFCN